MRRAWPAGVSSGNNGLFRDTLTSYAALVAHHRRLFNLRHVEAMASWDEATMMPDGGGDARAEALSTLRGLIHQEATHERLSDLFRLAVQELPDLTPWQQANLRAMEREWVRATALPRRLVEAASQAETRSEQAWRKLRPDNDFAGFLPLFREVVRLKREVAQALADKLDLSPYDALLDEYEPGATAESIGPLFARLRAYLPALIAKAVEKQASERVVVSDGPFPQDRQQWLVTRLMRAVGFDFNHGRLDASPHGFCSSVPTDVRITTSFDAVDFTRAMMGVLHECGHGKYQQNLPPEWLDQPIGAGRSTFLHESQSLLLEMQVGRSRAFLEFAAPLIAEAFPVAAGRAPASFHAENLFLQLTRVRPGLIRGDADEATYPCHIIIRFEIERRLIDGALRPEDVPEAWDQGMHEMLGIRTGGNDRDGCLQDVHWPAGMFGYFPTYTLGALIAAQLFGAVEAAHPDVHDQIRRGDLRDLDGWLRQRVWGQGSSLVGLALVERATGRPLSTDAFEQHLESRYVLRQG
jgi:carboxypeptidase Taq